MTDSREARELAAVHILALSARDGFPSSPTDEAPWPDGRSLLADALALRDTEPARALLFADAWALATTRRARDGHRRAWRDGTVTLRGETVGTPLPALASAVATDPSLARREALVRAGDAVALALRDRALDAVEALRTVAETLAPPTLGAMGIGDTGSEAILAATEDLYAELDLWACRALEIDRARITWAERLRSLQTPALPAAVPPPTWASVGSQWMLRTGLEAAARRITDALQPAARVAEGVVVLPTVPGSAAVVSGRPSAACAGAMEVSGALAEALAHALGQGPTVAARRGADAGVFGLASELGRGMYLDRHFLRREAGVDAAPRQRVMLECLHTEVIRLRLEAAAGMFTAMALARAPDTAGRFTETFTRAVGCSPSPVWAVHLVARALEPDGRHGARIRGALALPALTDALRARFDEDWFRNPRAGQGLGDLLQHARTAGVDAWRKVTAGDTTDPARELSRWLSEVLADARRTTA